MRYRLKKISVDEVTDDKFGTKQMSGLFLVEFYNSYDLAMVFLRYQEFYESASPKFKNKQFSILDYMEWYSKCHSGSFTYPTDWAGFNIPSHVYYSVAGSCPDHNKYDICMDNIVKKIETLLRSDIYKNANFYLIGVVNDSNSVLEHEIAHGMYHINKDYKKEMDCLYATLSDKNKITLHKTVRSTGI